jgi:lysophospholipase L1-like esterase
LIFKKFIMKNKQYILLLIFSLSFLSFIIPQKITIWLCGDSTISEKAIAAYPETGWGMPFTHFWDDGVQVRNLAKNGRSTKTFIAEGLWKKVVDSATEGDFVFIQFGHNDEVPEKKDRYTTPDQFKFNLTKFVKEAKLKKAIPILLTPVSRRKFDSLGNAESTHAEYTKIVKEVAISENVLLIDLDTKSQNLFQKFGEENSKLLFLQLAPGEHPNYPNGKIDNTHFNELGARLIAQLVLNDLRGLNTNLNAHIVQPKP